MGHYEGWFDLIGEGLERSKRRTSVPPENNEPGNEVRDDRDIESLWVQEGGADADGLPVRP